MRTSFICVSKSDKTFTSDGCWALFPSCWPKRAGQPASFALLCFGEEGSLRMCCCTDPLAVHTVPQKHQKSGVGDVASEQLVVDCFGTSCPGAEE